MVNEVKLYVYGLMIICVSCVGVLFLKEIEEWF